MLKVMPQSLLQFDPLSDFNLLDEDYPASKWSGDWVSRRWVDGLKTLHLIPLKGARRADSPRRGPLMPMNERI